ncbi:uncharacterized protein G2W53_031393 [Senna tora]|uniref:Uncharacterized protein n=1 Tax=Senna tora TaxID=362788 RepID=A0A834THD1_9FABA|nr:uncharacterized protein G2W53_031393 [Senna tora]
MKKTSLTSANSEGLSSSIRPIPTLQDLGNTTCCCCCLGTSDESLVSATLVLAEAALISSAKSSFSSDLDVATLKLLGKASNLPATSMGLLYFMLFPQIVMLRTYKSFAFPKALIGDVIILTNTFCCFSPLLFLDLISLLSINPSLPQYTTTTTTRGISETN